MAVPVVITGIGLATPLGTSATETWQSLLAGRFITDHAHVPLAFPSDRRRIDELAHRTAVEAIQQALWTADCLGNDRTALVVGTSKGPIESWLTPLPHMACSPCIAGGLNPSGISDLAAALASRLGVGAGPRLTLSAACASGLHALIRGTLLIQSGEADRVLIVAAESSLHPLFLASFRRLGVLPRDGIGCRPFDQARDGFLMSEAAAAVCLEAYGASASRANPIRIDRFAFGGDATHLTGSDPQGITLKNLLARVLDCRPVDLVQAHGTGTIANDPIELTALEATLPEASLPALYSHKGALGHSLGAAGLVSIVLNCLIHQHGVVPPNVRTRNPLPMRRVRLVAAGESHSVRRSLALAAGFGGAVAIVSLQS